MSSHHCLQNQVARKCCAATALGDEGMELSGWLAVHVASNADITQQSHDHCLTIQTFPLIHAINNICYLKWVERNHKIAMSIVCNLSERSMVGKKEGGNSPM